MRLQYPHWPKSNVLDLRLQLRHHALLALDVYRLVDDHSLELQVGKQGGLASADLVQEVWYRLCGKIVGICGNQQVVGSSESVRKSDRISRGAIEQNHVEGALDRVVMKYRPQKKPSIRCVRFPLLE